MTSTVPPPGPPEPPEFEFVETFPDASRSEATTAVELLPPQRSGWSIRNSVRMLHEVDDVVRMLREEAVATAFSAASRAIYDTRDSCSAGTAAAARSASRRRIRL